MSECPINKNFKDPIKNKYTTLNTDTVRSNTQLGITDNQTMAFKRFKTKQNT